MCFVWLKETALMRDFGFTQRIFKGPGLQGCDGVAGALYRRFERMQCLQHQVSIGPPTPESKCHCFYLFAMMQRKPPCS